LSFILNLSKYGTEIRGHEELVDGIAKNKTQEKKIYIKKL
jgi:hypothetical protein